jgi:hypothetical protein
MSFGITERGDAGLDHSWINKADEHEGLILITKAPHKLPDIPSNAIVHCTITGFGGTVLEPGVERWQATIEAYFKLIEQYGSDRIVLRIDPIIPTKKGILAAQAVYRHKCGRVRISIIDAYQHVQTRLKEAGLPSINTKSCLTHYPYKIRKRTIELFPNAEICGEPDFESIGCVSVKDYLALGLDIPQSIETSSQRKTCQCLGTKTELLNNKKQCEHGCLYCYWR